MEMGLLMFPSPAGSAGMAQLVEGLGLRSLVFADTQCLTPEVWGQLMLAASVTDRIEIRNRRDKSCEPRPGRYGLGSTRPSGRERWTRRLGDRAWRLLDGQDRKATRITEAF